MRTVSIRLEDLQKVTIPLGFEGENLYTQVRIDCKKVFDEDQSFVPTLAIVAPSGEKYPGIVTRDGNIVTWEVSASDLTSKGTGELQLAFTKDEVIGKTYVARTRIERSIIPSGEVPTVIENFIIEAGEIVNGIPQMIDDALAEAKASGEFDGEDGVSPVVNITTITGGHRITITDAEGTHAFDVMDGEDGDTGNGIASIIKTGTSGLVDTYTITYTNGNTTTFTVTNGEKGDPGDPGHSPVITTNKVGKTTTILSDGQSIGTVLDGEDADPTTLIDDTAGDGVTNKTWSADKLTDEFGDLKSQINGVEQSIAPVETTATATAAHAVGELFMMGETLLVALSAIAVGDTITTTGGSPNAAVTTLSAKMIKDVQVNGSSILSQGVANVPKGDSSTLGVVKADYSGGIEVGSSGNLRCAKASSANMKAGTDTYRPIVSSIQHESAFYGLAKAAGADMASLTSPTVGVYPEAQRSAISQMLDAPETVSGTTPSITAKSGVRYVCGECATLTITAPASGIIDVTFDSGSTPTVLTVTPPTGMTMKWIGDDPTALEANKTYEVNIKDGCLGMVVSWT